MQFCQKIEDILVEEWIAHLDRRVHGDAVAFCLEKVAGQKNAGRNPHSTVHRMPTPGAFERKIQLCPRIRLPENLAHWFAVEAQFGNGEQSVGVDPGVRAAYRILNLLPPGICKVRYFVEPQISVAGDIA